MALSAIRFNYLLATTFLSFVNLNSFVSYKIWLFISYHFNYLFTIAFYFLLALIALLATVFNFLLTMMFCLILILMALSTIVFSFLLATLFDIKLFYLY